MTDIVKKYRQKEMIYDFIIGSCMEEVALDEFEQRLDDEEKEEWNRETTQEDISQMRADLKNLLRDLDKFQIKEFNKK